MEGTTERTNLTRLSKAADILAVTPTTLKAWCDRGWLILTKSPTGRYFVSNAELERLKMDVKGGVR